MDQLWTQSATTLLQALESRAISSVELCHALIERADATEPLLHAFVWRRREELFAEARAVDAARVRGDTLGPLAGLPVSIKENIDVAGSVATLGLRARAGRAADSDAVSVRSLREAGALVLGKTNVPQLLLAQETENAVYGTTPNPHDLRRTPGGSSGGEAAAIASGSSICGMGTDIGGSIRTPAHFCGIFGLKPTVDRISVRGSNGAVPGQEIVRAQMGPMARTAADLALLMAAIDPRRQAALDPAVPPLPPPDIDAVDVRGLRVGIYDDDGFLTPTPSLRRAVQQAGDALAAAGATLVPYRPVGAAELVYLWMGAVSADGGESMRRALGGEPWSPQLAASSKILTLPSLARAAAAKAMALRGEHRIAELLRVLGSKGVMQTWDIAAERTRLRRAELDAWATLGLDAVLCPAHACPAMPLRASGEMTLSLTHALRWSFLNFPAGVGPVTRVRDAEAATALGTLSPRAERIERQIAEVEAGAAGMPVGVQLVARPYREDVVLALLAALERGVRDADDYPVTPVTPQEIR
ncbi:MAG: hypothetical protein RIT45_1718 [Pseudomonadota bacterium]